MATVDRRLSGFPTRPPHATGHSGVRPGHGSDLVSTWCSPPHPPPPPPKSPHAPGRLWPCPQIASVTISTVGLLLLGKLLEPLWGSKEFLKFIMLVNVLTSICVFVTAIALYYITRQERYLYTPFSGFHGVLSGFLVGIKQILPDQELLKIKAKWMPTLVALISVATSFFTMDSVSYLPTLLFGMYISWIFAQVYKRI
ncbi:hypothetical protein Cni_G16606 [Canna indica]|uniref:Rhomboid protein n=1 Tax=Canna indica TaxID=4628 RepID=A0AAQ3KFN5_9LILI|nr:hypothetical protein Cni_G16606 [Canna indica]